MITARKKSGYSVPVVCGCCKDKELVQLTEYFCKELVHTAYIFDMYVPLEVEPLFYFMWIK